MGGPAPVCRYPCDDQPPEIEGFTLLACNGQGYPEYRHDQTGISFVLLPGGTFNMGSFEVISPEQQDDRPVHAVTLSPFLMAKQEVTQAEWKQVMGTNPSYFQLEY